MQFTIQAFASGSSIACITGEPDVFPCESEREHLRSDAKAKSLSSEAKCLSEFFKSISTPILSKTFASRSRILANPTRSNSPSASTRTWVLPFDCPKISTTGSEAPHRPGSLTSRQPFASMTFASRVLKHRSQAKGPWCDKFCMRYCIHVVDMTCQKRQIATTQLLKLVVPA